MRAILEAIIPIFGIIVLGFVFRHAAFPGDAFWPLAARLTYYVFFPALLIESLLRAEPQALALPMAGALAAGVLLIALLLLTLRPWLGLSDAAFTSVFQGSIRPNTYIGLAGAAALHGDTGLALAAIAIAATVPLVNLLSVATLTRYGANGAASIRQMALATARNPLIAACALGLLLRLAAIDLAGPPARLLSLVSAPALPLGLLTVGAGLRIRGLRHAWYPLVLASAVKLLVLPLLTLALGTLWQLSGPPLSIAILFAALPCASTAYVLALELGGDAQLMAVILTAQTVLAVLTMPLLALLW